MVKFNPVRNICLKRELNQYMINTKFGQFGWKRKDTVCISDGVNRKFFKEFTVKINRRSKNEVLADKEKTFSFFR